ncbi:hypothetical protein [Bacillus sp. PS06]|uniref:hypothetical protein n=1 Tax=Bacillus sp. PS06 TaxID=2764176 RepID=UPI001CD8E381|nr:hypothetical protein [Bacillus sp. PS06]
MVKKMVITVLLLAFIIGIYFFPAISTNHNNITTIPSTSLEKGICERVTEQFGDCKILLYDSTSHIVFAESSSGIVPVLTNKEFTAFKKIIYPILDFQEFAEEKVERGSIDWRAENNIQNDFSMIYGFAEDHAKTIVIDSENNIQPHRFLVREHLWVWYATFEKDEVKLPVEVTVYDAEGKKVQ